MQKVNSYSDSPSTNYYLPSTKHGFTIVELLVVIVVIGILASISLVSYSGLTTTASKTTLISDLKNASNQLEMDKTSDSSENYPATKEEAAEGAGLKSSPGSTFTYAYDSDSNAYCLLATNANNTSYYINSITKIPTEGSCPDFPSSFVLAWGGTGDEWGNSIVQNSDGGYAITGVTYGFGSGGGDMFLAKYDSDRALTWSKTWGGTGYDLGNSVVQTTDGGYAVTGRTDSFGAGNGDMFLVKYDSNGGLLWDKTWGGGNYDYGNSIVQTSDGGYAITGGSDSYGGYNDMFLAKYTSAGILSWSKTLGGFGGDYYWRGNSVVQTSDGGYAITGASDNYGANGTDMFLAKYTSDGVISWIKTWGGAGYDEGNSLVKTSDGGYVITGSTDSYGAGNEDMFIAKYTSAGILSWSKTWGGNDIDWGMSLVQTSDGGYAVTGYTEIFDPDADVFLAKYASNGSLLWDKTWGGTEYEDAISLAYTNDGGYAITGETDSYGAGGPDVSLIKFDSSGVISNCSAPMCQNPTAEESSPSPEESSPSPEEYSISPSDVSPNAVDSSQNATSTIVVAL